MSEDQRKLLKKRLGEGLIIPCDSGTLLAVCNPEEYKQSKETGGFIHQMPITLHVRGGGAGQYEDWISRYLSIEEAKLLRDMLDVNIKILEAA